MNDPLCELYLRHRNCICHKTIIILLHYTMTWYFLSQKFILQLLRERTFGRCALRNRCLTPQWRLKCNVFLHKWLNPLYNVSIHFIFLHIFVRGCAVCNEFDLPLYETSCHVLSTSPAVGNGFFPCLAQMNSVRECVACNDFWAWLISSRSFSL